MYNHGGFLADFNRTGGFNMRKSWNETVAEGARYTAAAKSVYVKNFLGRLRRNEEGASMVEYVVLLGLVLVVAIGAIITIGTQANRIFGQVAADLTAVP
jgi:pilus assembly protein Flp/PilA